MPEHISSWFRLRVSRTLPRRLRIARNRYCTACERIQSYPQVGLRRFGTIRGIRYKVGCNLSSLPDPGPGTQRGIERTNASIANTPQYIVQLSDLKSSFDPPFFIKTLVRL